MFKDDNLNTHTDSVFCYIGKCIDDVVPPWVNGEVRAKLKARTAAYNSGDLEYKSSTASPGMRSREILTVLRDNTGTKWSPTLRAPTQDTCGPDSEQ